MVFKRPGNSRDDRSNGSPGRRKTSDNKPSKTGSSRPSKSSNSRFDKTGARPGKNDHGNETRDPQKSFSSPRRKPYSGRPESGDAPARRSSGSGSFSRGSSEGKPKRAFGDDQTGEKKSYSSRGKAPYSGRPSSEDRPKRSFGGEQTGEKKSYSSRGKTPYSGKPSSDDRPKRSFAGESSERKSFSKPGFKSSERSSDKKFSSRSSEDTGYKPFRKSANSSYNKPAFKTERSPEDKPLRARKKSAEESGLIRLNRYISNAGICSRRKADELISAGVISVNGEVVSELGYKIDPNKDAVRYNGELLKREKMVYVLLNKPKDYITTTDDPQERRTVMQLVEKASRERIYPVGRLDRNTTGLLLMTNDGDLADKLSHPKNNIVKLYHAELNKSLTQGDLNKIAFGVELEDGFIKPDAISYVQGATKREVGIQIHSGKNRIVRRIFEHLGYEVVKLDRAVYANLTKKDLPRGRWRYLDEKEIIQLKHLI
ncbi:pseudouridine synthase [Mucilaginibacter sp. BT774]|uniref:pseudouridine synthase n=1 Tax=Mucilaginibacter sp. BT774 TaxID=3062276 RepID=UPI0026745C2D|nr:pseudouridine synthase [Mucilaginibacter sp. BT774]MDO3625606.1 pseudouridine synthase [Mucilaginibacter sp. BT774]